MIDHFTVTVADMPASKAFYEKALAPIGYAVRMEYMEFVGLGDEKKPYWWLKTGAPVTTPQHIAFRARSREAVDAFHKAALEAGARDDGAPGVREHYHPTYYAAFVVDPVNGHHLEVVTHEAPAAKKKPAAKAKKKAAPKKKKR
ncbi:MAG: VOC family protein [Myxococcaceae bacterium]|nr:VOC family protein [Myxococcaceae bacterium]